MSRVLQAIDSIHQVGIYCLALVPPNYLPKTPLGGIHLSETKRRFLEGGLHPANVLMCPHTCVTNLPKPREVHSGKYKYVFIFILVIYTAHTLLKCSLKLTKKWCYASGHYSLTEFLVFLSGNVFEALSIKKLDIFL